jgi:hypothetical protein
VASVRPHQRIETVLTQLEPHRAVRAVGDLLDRAATSPSGPAIPGREPSRPRSR